MVAFRGLSCIEVYKVCARKNLGADSGASGGAHHEVKLGNDVVAGIS
jgi:hypothetical protein